MSEGEQPIVYHPEPQSNVGKWILIVLAVAYAGASAFFIYDQHGKLDKVTQDQSASQKQIGDLTKRMQSAESGSMLAWPLDDRGGHRMTELVVAPPDGRELTICESDFIEGLALQAAVALENARFHKRNVEFARVQQDLDAARAIQRSLLPQTLPSIEGYSLAFKSVTCYEVGGDYLDIVAQPDGSLLIAVADVAGKGLASAISATRFRSAVRAMAVPGMPLDELATRMNQHHWTEGEEARRRYLTAIFLRLHPEAGEIEVVNAGHNPGFLVEPGAAPSDRK